MTDSNIVIIGGGGHARVTAGALQEAGVNILGYTEIKTDQRSTNMLGVPCMGDDSSLEAIDPASVQLVLGVGGAVKPDIRAKLFNTWKKRGYAFSTVVHPSAFVDMSVKLGEGAQIMAGAVLQPGSNIEKNVLINTRAVIDHDCRIAAHTHIAPGAVLCGQVDV
ncbi:hypothetical protein HN747_05770, partial [archaeon]|nr:hypothetical protein [archaeon]